MGFIAPLLLMQMHNREPDKRPRCPECGQVIEKNDEPAWRWAIGFFGSAFAAAVGFLFFLGTIIGWMDGGNSFSDPVLGEANRTLVSCLWQNLIWLWHLVERIF